MGRTLVIGDIHGGYLALEQVLQRCNFNNEEDQLISLGDYVDGWSDTYKVVEVLVNVKKKICILGNHDQWFIEWLNTGKHPCDWNHGGHGTALSYMNEVTDRTMTIQGGYGGYRTNLEVSDVPESHREFFKNLKHYYIDEKHRCFVHGGWDRYEFIDNVYAMSPSNLYWDRKMWYAAMSCRDEQKLMTVDGFKEIYIGHTSTVNWLDKNNKNIMEPMTRGGVTNMDSGGGWRGKLSIMDIDTKEVWQSDKVDELYFNEKGRN